jgi:hypothetical protein
VRLSAQGLALDRNPQATALKVQSNSVEGVQLMDRYLTHNCPRCRGLMGVVVQRPKGTTLQAVNGKCLRCRHRLAWIVIRGNRSAGCGARVGVANVVKTKSRDASLLPHECSIGTMGQAITS